MPRREFRQGEIYSVDFGRNAVGHEYQKRRPGIVIQSNEQLAKTNLITVMPITSKLENKTADDILVCKDERNLLLDDSLIKVSNIASFDPQRFFYKIGEAGEDIISSVKIYLRKHFAM